MGTGLRLGLSGLIHRAARWQWRPWKNALIRLFMRRYRVDLSQAERGAPEAYRSFNDFFTRSLKPEARPIAADGLASPVDGVISAVGMAADNQLFQAKGKTYTLEDLFAGDEEQARPYRNGPFITLYLSPRDYHRVHMPADGALRAMLYAPGRLFSVNAAATRRVDKLFARNERVIAAFDSPLGRLAVIMVVVMVIVMVTTIVIKWYVYNTISCTHNFLLLSIFFPFSLPSRSSFPFQSLLFTFSSISCLLPRSLPSFPCFLISPLSHF